MFTRLQCRNNGFDVSFNMLWRAKAAAEQAWMLLLRYEMHAVVSVETPEVHLTMHARQFHLGRMYAVSGKVTVEHL